MLANFKKLHQLLINDLPSQCAEHVCYPPALNRVALLLPMEQIKLMNRKAKFQNKPNNLPNKSLHKTYKSYAGIYSRFISLSLIPLSSKSIVDMFNVSRIYSWPCLQSVYSIFYTYCEKVLEGEAGHKLIATQEQSTKRQSIHAHILTTHPSIF